jgi:ribosome-binding protein aMBF1 (putative translation factor)
MGIVILGPHLARPSRVRGPNSAGSAKLLFFSSSRENGTRRSAGNFPRARQLDTAESPTPASSLAVSCPMASITDSMDVSIIADNSSRGVNLSSVHTSGIEPRGRVAHNWPMPLTNSSIAKRLQLTREALEVSAAELCRRIGCKPNRWSQYEGGERRITLEIADKICEAYGVTLDWIYRGDPSALPSKLHQKLSMKIVA